MNQLITKIESRDVFERILANNPGVVILKFGAPWCGPCNKIGPEVHSFFASLPQDGSVICGDINVDNSSDVYSFLKASRRVNGIPVILCYARGYTQGIIPTLTHTGSDKAELQRFFAKCKEYVFR